jgi:hypothetical protein
VISIVGGVKNYNNYRKLFVKDEKKAVVNDETTDNLELPSVEQSAIVIDENNQNQPQNYVS